MPAELISPLDAARRQRKTKIFHQNYLNGAWKALRQNPIVLLDKYYNLANERKNYLSATYKRVQKFTRMLHARSPIYNAVHRRCSNPEVLERFHLTNIYRIQYQTRRNMLSILRNIRDLRAQNDTVGLRKLVSKVMGDYNVLKTRRVKPWQMNFMNEVYNHLALSLCENFRMPTYRVSPYDNDAMCRLLGVLLWKPAEPQSIVFGNRATYAYEDADTAFEEAKVFRRTINGLSKRLHFARLPMERSYLLHELADIHLSHNHLVQCLDYATRSVEEAARSANIKIWEFLATMLQVKVHAILGKYERLADVLNNAYRLAMDLKATNLCTFIEFCRMLNMDSITLRKISIVMANKRRQKISSRSSYNTLSPETPDADVGVNAVNVA
ncbi:uncharacterized protein LOC6569538 [Drosophila grimshawi]|uniref:GH17765 n=1 Tax=Drosophila grimshawi TaxID=7222 RepID=B4JXM2_DROGR|nr:uncharacterized protein LOC6569538 [Drosophila grimshawi]EDV95121.1 GH17765 [Drosophila grimshawi]